MDYNIEKSCVLTRSFKRYRAVTLNQLVEKYKKEHVLNLYKSHPDEIDRDRVNENETKDDYEGREVLELLQNAVDEVDLDGKISIILNGNILTIANTGKPFDFSGVKSLMKSNLSPKRLKKNTIGQKGLGFRSLLNWSHDISIYSDSLSIRFSEAYRKAYFEAEKIIQPTALLVAPEVIDNVEKNEFATVIKIKITEPNKIKEVVRQINSIDRYTLLFLNKINVLDVQIENQIKVFKREAIKDIVIISENEETFTFNTFSKRGSLDGKNYEIVIAYDDSIVQKDNKLYSFFETSISFPIKWKCHATFDLETNRNGIKKSDDNQKILSELVSFIFEKATELKSVDLQPYHAFDSLINTSDFPADLNIKGVNFNDTYKQYFTNAKVLPTLSNRKIALIDKPLFYSSTQFFFKDIPNNNILIDSEDKFRNQIIQAYSIKFDDKTLLEVINASCSNWQISQQVAVFLWWENEFPKSSEIPKLIKKNDGDYIKADMIIYFVRGRDLNIPSWSKIIQLDQQYEDELKKQILEAKVFQDELAKEPIIERVIARNSGKSLNKIELIPHITFRDADASTILTPINATIEKNYDYAKLFVQWLWENYSQKEEWTPPIDIRFNLPSTAKTVEKASNLYFDDSFGYALAGKLFINGKYKPFISWIDLGIKKEEIDQFITFIKKIGVNEYPPLIKQNIHDEDFIILFKPEYLLDQLPSKETDARNPRLINLSFNVIENLFTILESLTIAEIYEWIMADMTLHDELNLRHSGEVSFNYTALTKAYRNKTFNDYSYSYVKFIFQHSKWLKINGKTYKPNQCMFAYSSIDIQAVVPTITNSLIKEFSEQLGIQLREVRKFLADVGVKTSFTDLDSDDFYRVLLALPTLDQSGQISEKIYREIIDMQGEISIDSLNYKKFIDEGYVFTKNHDGKQYHLASASFFSNSIQVNVGNYHIMSTPLRNGSFEVFNRTFGVKKFEEKYKVSYESIIYHHENNQFQDYFKEFISYARAWSERNDNIKKKIDNIRLQIVSRITLLDNEESRPITNDYSFITDKNAWFIYVNDLDTLDYYQISKCVEDLFTQVANTSNNEIPNQLGELFRDSNGRKFLVEKHFGTITVTNQSHHDLIRENLATTLKIPYDSNQLDDINFVDFNSTENHKALITLLTSFKRDVVDIKKDGFDYTDYIDFRPYYQEELRNYIAKYEGQYKNLLFIRYQSKSMDIKRSYYKEYMRFKNFSMKSEEIENSIFFDWKKKFNQVFAFAEAEIVNVKADTQYNSNFEMISRGLDKEKFGDFIDEDTELKSLIYFLNDEIRKLILEKFNLHLSLNFSNDPGDTTLPFNIDEIVLTQTTIKPISASLKPGRLTATKTHTKSAIEKGNKTKDKNGKLAEKMVRDKLLPILPSLKWTSENSNVPSERNTSISYDMEYIKGNQRHFIEVKATTGVFYMSVSEYNFAVKNHKNYEIYLVDLDKKKINGPHSIKEFEASKISTEFQFGFEDE